MSSSSTSPASQSPSTLREDSWLIGLVGLAHAISHFSQLVLPPLFPWLKDAFGVSYTELGAVLTVFFVVSCVVQAASGFVVDRFGPRPVLFGGLGLLALSILGYALAPNYQALIACAVVAGVGNGVFHPVDYTLFNRKVAPTRLGHAYSVHGITGNLGWALAPALLGSIAIAYSWRIALMVAAGLAAVVWLILLFNRSYLALDVRAVHKATGLGGEAPRRESPFAFMAIPAVWMCFAFFFVYATALSVVNTFAPAAASHLHDMPVSQIALCLTLYMVCSAIGMVPGGFLAADPQRCERVVGLAFGGAAVVALVLAFADLPAGAVPVMFALMGGVAGLAGPSRDLLVKRSTPAHASGRVYGVVYAGLDIGQALAPLVFGRFMDAGHYRSVIVGLAIVQGLLIVSALRVRHVRREPLVPASV